MSRDLLADLRNGKELDLRDQTSLILRLSLPAMMAQVSSIAMQYIDASMVGRLGASDSASIGLVSSSTWLFGGLCGALITGFTVQTAQQIGAKRDRDARNVMKLGILLTFAFSLFVAFLGACIHKTLPGWLGGSPEICAHASAYFLIFCLALPVSQLNGIAGGMLQASGNMRLPSILHVLMCGLDVIFNMLLIFPSRRVLGIMLPGAGLGVAGAALGTALAQLVTALFMLYALLLRSPILHLRRHEPLRFDSVQLRYSGKVAVPVALEHIIACGAQVMSTRIVAPLGTVAIAANSFAVTAESLCYMPGYGIGSAASTLIGQSIGAGRSGLSRRLGNLTTLLGVCIMTVAGAAMYFAAPWMIGVLSPDPDVVALGTEVLRIEAFAEPLYGASIVASGVLRGAGDTLVSGCLAFSSMWLVRIPIAAFLSRTLGLRGVWIAMCIELCVRGILFLLRLRSGRWMRHSIRKAE